MKRSIWFGVRLLILYLVMVLMFYPVPNQGLIAVNALEHYRFSDAPFKLQEVQQALPQLKTLYGQNKTVPSKYELSFYTALSFYPELSKAKISVQSSDKISTTMRAKPSNGCLFWWKRHYHIDINDLSTETVNMSKATFTELTGCFIHELAHIKHYEGQRNGPIILTGIRYISSDTFKAQLEKSTDRLAIQQGGGYYIYQFADFIFNRAEADSSYLQNKIDNYYSPSDLLELYQQSLSD